jgi:hypothetical protein
MTDEMKLNKAVVKLVLRRVLKEYDTASKEMSEFNAVVIVPEHVLSQTQLTTIFKCVAMHLAEYRLSKKAEMN